MTDVIPPALNPLFEAASAPLRDQIRRLEKEVERLTELLELKDEELAGYYEEERAIERAEIGAHSSVRDIESSLAKVIVDAGLSGDVVVLTPGVAHAGDYEMTIIEVGSLTSLTIGGDHDT